MSPRHRGGRPFWNRLTVRLGAALVLGAAAILVLAAWWNLDAQRRQMTELVRASGEVCAGIVRSATREAMLHDDPEEVRRILETISAQGTVDRIRLFDKMGRVHTSTDPADVGTVVPTSAEQCIACHDSDEPLSRPSSDRRMRIFRATPGGERVLGVIAPIPNEPACARAPCHAHDPSQRILGVLDVHLSLASVDAAVDRSERQLLAGALGTVVAVLTLSWLLTWLMVLRPTRQLAAAADRVAGGDLGGSIPSRSRDEVGDLTRSWNSMVEELSRARDELREWGRSLQERVDEKTRELQRAHGRMLLVEKMASLGKLSAVMAHELNNPLTGIATYARLVRRRGSLDEETGRILEMIETEATRCGNIVRNLLLFSRTPPARRSEQPLGPIFERCRLLLQHQAELKGVELRLEELEAVPPLTCDAGQIQQVLLALTMNAIEATPAGGTVALSARPSGDGGSVLLEVVDTGRGIPPAELHRIFEPFYSTKETGGGAGLGLAVAYGIVQRHGGTIDVRSEPREGTVFRISLPLRPPEHADGGEPERTVKDAPLGVS